MMELLKKVSGKITLNFFEGKAITVPKRGLDLATVLGTKELKSVKDVSGKEKSIEECNEKLDICSEIPDIKAVSVKVEFIIYRP